MGGGAPMPLRFVCATAVSAVLPSIKRRLLNFLCLISLLLFISILLLWLYLPYRKPLTFYTTSSRYTIDAPWYGVRFEIMGGILRSNGTFKAPPGKHWDSDWANAQPLPLGFGFGKSPASDPTAAPYLGLVFPWWALFTVTAALPCLWLTLFLRARRRLRNSANLCPHCGYDLRASSDRCPECGESIQRLIP